MCGADDKVEISSWLYHFFGCMVPGVRSRPEVEEANCGLKETGGQRKPKPNIIVVTIRSHYSKRGSDEVALAYIQISD